MNLTTLIESHVGQPDLLAEYGMSVLVRAGEQKILFNIGNTSAFAHNSIKLGISLEEVDSLVISNSELVKSEGFSYFLEKNSTAAIYLPAIPGGNPEFIFSKEQGAQMVAERAHLIHGQFELCRGVFVFPVFLASQTNPLAGSENSGMPELILVLQSGNALTILCTGLSGDITPILPKLEKMFHQPIHLLLGGISIIPESASHYAEVLDSLNKSGAEAIGIGFTTALETYCDLALECRCKVFYNSSGTQITLS